MKFKNTNLFAGKYFIYLDKIFQYHANNAF